MLHYTWHPERLSGFLCGQRHRRYIQFFQVSIRFIFRLSFRFFFLPIPIANADRCNNKFVLIFLHPMPRSRFIDETIRCLQYMSDFNSCLLQNFGVLAGPPSRVKALLVSTTYSIISWQPPKILPDTVTEYHVFLRKLGSGSDYSVVEKDHNPIIVEDLEPGTRYEVFVVSMNAHGKGRPSPRLILQTKHEVKISHHLLLHFGYIFAERWQ